MTESRVQVERIGPVALLALGATALGPGQRAALMASLDALEADPETGAAILVMPRSADPEAGADIAAEGAPALADLCDAVESFGRPVIAALAGCAGGAFAELALAAHFRLAAPGPCLHLPGILTGTLEGGGATQRLPRLAGPEVALRLLLGGEPLSAEAAQAAGLLDGVVQGDLVETALSLAERLAEGGVTPLRARDRAQWLADQAAYKAALGAAREAPDGPARGPVIECVEAALVLPFEAGIGFERAVASALRQAPEAAALRHVVSTERRAAAQVRPVAASEVASVEVAGGGDGGAALALALLEAGLAVSVADPAGAAGLLSRIGAGLSADLAAGRIGEAERRDRLSRLTSAGGTADASRDVVLLFAPPDGRLRRTPLRSARAGGPVLVTVVPPVDPVPAGDAATAANGAELRLVMAERFRPGCLAELVAGGATPPAHLDAVHALLQRLGARPVRSGLSGRSLLGLLVGRLRTAADHMLEDGAAPRAVDAALEAAGYACGPYRMLDRHGLGPAFYARRARAAMRDPRDRYVQVLDRLHAAGRTGRASGRGYYDYPEGIPEGLPSEEVERLVQDARREAGIEPRRFADEDIRERCELALIHAGFTALSEGVARSPAAVDLAAIHGAGFPRSLGGPMYQARLVGLETVRRRFEDLARREDARFWAVPDLLGEMIARGEALPSSAPRG